MTAVEALLVIGIAIFTCVSIVSVGMIASQRRQ